MTTNVQSAVHYKIPIIIKRKLTRSSNKYLLSFPSKYQHHGTNIRSWSISTPYIWNSLRIFYDVPHTLLNLRNTTKFKKHIQEINQPQKDV